jgi:hypothetical protein
MDMKTIKEEGRLSLRPATPHEESSTERAARRIAELREHNNANVDEGTDKFATLHHPMAGRMSGSKVGYGIC